MFSQIDPSLLLARLEARRAELGALRSTEENPEPLSWVEVGSQAGIHSATFSRLKAGTLPGDATMPKILSWLGITDPFDLVPDPEAPETPTPSGSLVGGMLETHAIALVGEQGPELVTVPEGSPLLGHNGECADCGDPSLAADPAPDDGEPTEDPDSTKTAAIMGIGSLSESEDPETQAAVLRVRELMNEGAVGVSIMHDLNPDDMPDQSVIDALVDAEDWDGLDALFADIHARPRHVAVVDTAAFSDARLSVDENGVVSGPVTFEGMWTGDQRMLPYGVLTWDDDLLPIPIIWDREDGDHSGMTVGSISSLERVDGVVSSMSPLIEEDAVAAAAGTTALPAAYFKQFKADKAMPLKVEAPDAQGRRRFWGTAAPRGVCHRSDMGACFQYPGDVDKELRNFHTGFEIALDDGTSVRPGAITSGGLHIDTNLARRGVSARDVNRHREDSNKVLSLVRAWDTPHGLDVSGVLAANVTEDQLLQAMAGSPSVELWPSGRGRTLVGVHVVPTPAWPVVSAAGSSLEFSSSQSIEIEDPPVEETALVASVEKFDLTEMYDSLKRIEMALGLLVSDNIADGIPEPE